MLSKHEWCSREMLGRKIYVSKVGLHGVFLILGTGCAEYVSDDNLNIEEGIIRQHGDLESVSPPVLYIVCGRFPQE